MLDPRLRGDDVCFYIFSYLANYSMKQPAVYILASKRNGTLYTGVTSNLIQRVYEHREGLADGFTKRYQVKMLVWYELHTDMQSAIAREKAIKKWNRAWKLRLIEEFNPNWQDFWDSILL